MADMDKNRVSWVFWCIAIIALLWNALGVISFITQPAFNPDAMQQLTAEQRVFVEETPLWAMIAYGVAVFGGLAGAVALLMRRKIAALLFGASLLGVVVQFSHAYLFASTKVSWDAAQTILPILVMVVAVSLYLYARKLIAKDVLN